MDEKTGSVTTPIYQSSTFGFTRAEEVMKAVKGESSSFVYTRWDNPTVRRLERKLAELEGAESVLGHAADSTESVLGISPELETALATLPDRQREILALRFGGDLTGPEIAELTGLSVANVQQILSRSLRQLRANLDAEPAPEPS